MMVQRKTASRYLDKIVAMGLLEKVKLGTSNYYVNAPLVALLSRVTVPENVQTGPYGRGLCTQKRHFGYIRPADARATHRRRQPLQSH